MERFTPVDDDIIELRRDLHLHPELSCHEDRTAELVAGELKKLGLQVFRAPKPGHSLLGVLDTGRPGRTLALRADMDALPLQENRCNLKVQKRWVSENDGAAHTCGHDFHTAGLIASARRLTAISDELSGRVIFCFESGEEIGMGDDARELLAEHGPIDAVYGVHVKSDYPVGSVLLLDDACTAGCETFKFTVHGKSAHGATPHLGIDPINCAAQIVVNANSIIPHGINSSDAAVLTVCSFHGGASWNRIPDDCIIEGGLRFYSEEVGRQLHVMLDRMADGVATANGCTVEKSWRNLTLPVMNDPELVVLAREAVTAAGAELVPGEPWMASETFARYAKIAPTVMAFVGCGNLEKGYGAPQHSDRFEADEECLAIDADVTVSFARKFLGK